jgi:hypothetical protein
VLIVCLYVCVRAHTHTLTGTHMYVHAHTCVCARAHTHTHTCMCELIMSVYPLVFVCIVGMHVVQALEKGVACVKGFHERKQFTDVAKFDLRFVCLCLRMCAHAGTHMTQTLTPRP